VVVVKLYMSNLSAISWREQVTFRPNDDGECFVLGQKMFRIIIVPTHWNNSPQLHMYSHLISLLQANQSLLLLLNVACLAEKQQIFILVFELTMIYHTQSEHTNHNTTKVIQSGW